MDSVIHGKADVSHLNWISTGNPSAGTVLLLHPVGLDLTYWDNQIDALRAEHNVVAFDLPGHGRSGGKAENWSFPYAVEVVSNLMEEIGQGSVHLVGCSFGGMIAQAVAIAKPGLVRSLTLIGTAPTFAEPVRAGMRARAQTARAEGMQALVQSSLERWLTPETRASRPHLADRLTKTLLNDDPEVHAAIWDIIADTFDVFDRLGAIKCPTLVLVGKQDPSTPPSSASLLADNIPNARMVVLPGTSHMAMLESPAAVNAELLNFLR